MGEYLVVKDPLGTQLYSGKEDEIADYLKVKYKDVKHALETGQLIKNIYKIEYEKKENTPRSIQEHLWTEDGKRRYEYRKGFPNRYKDASCVRFTPL